MNAHDRMLRRYAADSAHRCGECRECYRAVIGYDVCGIAVEEGQEDSRRRPIKWDPQWMACALWTARLEP